MPPSLSGAEERGAASHFSVSPDAALLRECLHKAQGPVQIRAWGLSMLPSIWPGAALGLEAPTELAIGDVVVVETKSLAVIHRIQRLTEDRVWTRGDAHRCWDGPMPVDAVIGRVRGLVLGRRSWEVEPIWSRRIGIAASLLGPASALGLKIARRITREVGRHREVRLAAAQEGDRDALRRLLVKSGLPVLHALAESRTPGYLIARTGASRPVGFTQVRPDGRLSLWVEPWFRGRGVGTALLDRCFEFARRRAMGRIWVRVRLGRTAVREAVAPTATGWWTRRGFRLTAGPTPTLERELNP